MRLEWRAAEAAGPRLGLLFGALLILGAASAAVWFSLGLPVPVCRLRQLTGLPCPTCGSTRLVQALLRGEVVEAFLHNPFVFAVGLALASWSVGSAATRLFRLSVPRLHLESRERWLVCIVALLAAVLSWIFVVWRDV